MDVFLTIIFIILGIGLLFLIVCFLVGYFAFKASVITTNPQAVRDSNSKDPIEKYLIPFTDETEKRLKSLNMEEFEIRSFDGLKLHGYLKLGSNTNKFIISVHGRPGTGFRTSAQFSEWITNYNYNCLFIDLRSYGKSEGKYTTFGVNDHKDLLYFINYLIDRFGENIEIALMGISMGANTCMLTVNKIPSQVKCLIADCGFTSAKDEFIYQLNKNYHMPLLFLPFIRIVTRLIAGFDLYNESALDTLKNSRVPVCFITGDSDDIVPSEMTIKCYDACESKKELHVFKGVKHARSYFLNQDEYKSICLDFFGKYF